MPDTSYHSPTYWQASTQLKETSQWVTGLDAQLKQTRARAEAPLQLSHGTLQTDQTTNSFWLIYQFESGGKLAIRTCYDPQFIDKPRVVRKHKTAVEYEIPGALGRFRVRIERPEKTDSLLRYTTSLKPEKPFSVQAFPRDIYLLDQNHDPDPTRGMVYVTQSGPTAGLVYLSVTEPQPGTLFYFQNFTALNDYFQVTQTDPCDTVSAQWPEAGFALPGSENPLPAGNEIVLSDAYVYLTDQVPRSEFEAADQFLEAIAAVYKNLPRPETAYYDWPKAAERTVDALATSTHCGRTLNKTYYLNAYVDVTQKPPESMVQLAILVPLWEYQEWLGKPVGLVERLKKNLPSFYEEAHETIMRWLPGGKFKEEKESRSEEQDPNKIDSWYLLHTLMNLGRLADMGDTDAKELLFRSLEFVIKAAHEFNYDWPVFYDVRTLAVVKAETEKGMGGELDVAGLYTHVMVQAYELTKEPRYLQEAITSAEQLQGKGFELLYQSNITIMSSLTLAKLWKITGNRLYFDQSRLSVANVLAKLWIWECNFGAGSTRSTFLGMAPLKNAPYLAAYEEGEIYATLLNYLKEVGPDVPDPVRLLFAEYMKYLLHRGRYYFPSELPADTICQEPREGHIIRELPIPLEDIPTGWSQAGEVGQEVYGGALAAILTTYTYKRFEKIPVVIFSDYPIYHTEYEFTDKQQGYVVIRLAGTADFFCTVRLLPKNRSLPDVRLFDESVPGSAPLKPVESAKQYREYRVRGNQQLRMEWNSGAT
ncbi:hypothetical protein [Larkinella rosea]|uniref:Uncharacterized protein n=1 Tax=Larkinella rosea TaxID=2025312 RepID=A0A3P1C7S9_9BACT|nr:hypothetical protein [Larkinella rosea]RRB09317.1 hypothetical protein EHT25_00200 [Larkinella rosea]